MQKNLYEPKREDYMNPETFMKKNVKIEKATEEGFNGSPDTWFSDEEYLKKLAGNMDYKNEKDYYFSSYSKFYIHEEMIKDKVRTESYMAAILNNPQVFKDKVVLDIGCGSGILSIFAAKAGAKKVYGIDFADIADYANDIVKKNNFADRVTILKIKVEDANIPEEVDIIISEWMGYFLIYESMLDCVIFARDKWLKKDGIILPDRAVLNVAGIEDNSFKRSKTTFWDNVYDINMDCFKPYMLKEPMVDYCDRKMVNSTVSRIFEINLYTVKKGDLDFSKAYEITFFRNDTFNGLVSWFDIFFDKLEYKVQFSTGPFTPRTHWKQTILYSDQDIFVNKGEIIKGSVAVRKSDSNFRALDIKISYHYQGQNKNKDFIQLYKLK